MTTPATTAPPSSSWTSSLETSRFALLEYGDRSAAVDGLRHVARSGSREEIVAGTESVQRIPTLRVAVACRPTLMSEDDEIASSARRADRGPCERLRVRPVDRAAQGCVAGRGGRDSEGSKFSRGLSVAGHSSGWVRGSELVPRCSDRTPSSTAPTRRRRTRRTWTCVLDSEASCPFGTLTEAARSIGPPRTLIGPQLRPDSAAPLGQNESAVLAARRCAPRSWPRSR